MAESSRGWWLRLPRPKTFLGIVSLQSGTEIISLAFLINRATGIYGAIALLTGFSMTALQLSMYFISILMVVALLFLIPHIRRPSPFHNLALAWLYMLDTAVNTAYTTSFAIAWYLAGLDDDGSGSGGSAPPAETSPGSGGGGNGSAVGWSGAGGNSSHGGGGGDGGKGDGEMQVRETAISMVAIVAVTVVRFYFAVVVAAHARAVLHRFCEGRRTRRGPDAETAGDSKGGLNNPFAKGWPEGEGWKGWLGRAMVSIGPDYWLAKKEDEEWARGVGAKLRSSRSRGPQHGYGHGHEHDEDEGPSQSQQQQYSWQHAQHEQEQQHQAQQPQQEAEYHQLRIQGGATTSTDAGAFRI